MELFLFCGSAEEIHCHLYNIQRHQDEEVQLRLAMIGNPIGRGIVAGCVLNGNIQMIYRFMFVLQLFVSFFSVYLL